jgi:hypothetical protein
MGKTNNKEKSVVGRIIGETDLQGMDSNICFLAKSTNNCLKFRKFWQLLAIF